MGLLGVGLLAGLFPSWIGGAVAGAGVVILIGRTYLNSLIMANGDTVRQLSSPPSRT